MPACAGSRTACAVIKRHVPFPEWHVPLPESHVPLPEFQNSKLCGLGVNHLESYIFYVILSLVKLLPEEGFELGTSGTIFLT